MGDDNERLDDLYHQNDQIERELARIDKHGRREAFGEEESRRKADLMAELNEVIAEIEKLEHERKEL